MSDFIKINLASQSVQGIVESHTKVSYRTTSGPLTLGDPREVTNTTTGGSGTGLQITVDVSPAILPGASIDATQIVILDGGSGYQQGDIIFIPSVGPSGSFCAWAADLKIEVRKTTSIGGVETGEHVLVPTSNAVCIKSVSETNAIIQINSIVASPSTPATGSADIMQYSINMDSFPATTKAQLWADVSEAFEKASRSKNSQPEVKFTNSAKCLSVVLS